MRSGRVFTRCQVYPENNPATVRIVMKEKTITYPIYFPSLLVCPKTVGTKGFSVFPKKREEKAD
jgi:hypothetical protein